MSAPASTSAKHGQQRANALFAHFRLNVCLHGDSLKMTFVTCRKLRKEAHPSRATYRYRAQLTLTLAGYRAVRIPAVGQEPNTLARSPAHVHQLDSRRAPSTSETASKGASPSSPAARTSAYLQKIAASTNSAIASGSVTALRPRGAMIKNPTTERAKPRRARRKCCEARRARCP